MDLENDFGLIQWMADTVAGMAFTERLLPWSMLCRQGNWDLSAKC